jgi:ParB family chromosome partitioning protein
MLEVALIENVQRADLNSMEEAEAYRQLVEEFGLSHEAVAKRVGKSRVAVTNTLRLLGLADVVKQALVDEKLTEGHARALLALSTQKAQASAMQTVINLSLSVRQAEELIRKLAGQKPIKAKKPSRSADVNDVEKRLQNSLGTKVALKHGKKGGTVTIYYYSDEELDALLEKLM